MDGDVDRCLLRLLLLRRRLRRSPPSEDDLCRERPFLVNSGEEDLAPRNSTKSGQVTCSQGSMNPTG
jgi:hypothetical protein